MSRLRFIPPLLVGLLFTAPARAQTGEHIPGGADEVPVGEAEPEPPRDEVLAPDRPPPMGKGVIWGQLTDTKRGEPLIEARVTVRGKGIEVFTDFDGFYRLELPPGRYDLELWYEGHEAIELRGVRVAAGQRVKLDEKLEPIEGAVDVIEVEEEAATSSIEGQLLTRKRSANVGDSVGRQEIGKTPDRNAAEAARRVPGANVVDGRFVYVRGLGERYTNALLDGNPLPSPEPDRQTVPLDLFPTQMVESITINKTFTPDMPGDFAGGSVHIDTRRLPHEFTFSTSLSLGFNTQSTFRDGLTYRGGHLDWLGFDDGKRQLPDEIPDYKLCRTCQRPDGEFVSPEELRGHGRRINSYRSSQRATIPPDHRASIVLGNSWKLGSEQRLGVMGAVSYARSWEAIHDGLLRTVGFPRNDSPEPFQTLNELTVERVTDKVRWGVLAKITFEASARHRFHLTGLYSRSADDRVLELEGFHEEKGAVIHDTRLRFVARDLAFGQLRGEHEIEELHGGLIDWHLSLARAGRDEPNHRGTAYQLDSGSDTRPPGFAFEDDSLSGMHFYSDQSERTLGGGLDWTQPLTGRAASKKSEPTKIKIGGLFQLRDRSFDARRFRFRPLPGADPASQYCVANSWDPTCSDRIFTQESIGTLFGLEENTQANDAYDAGLDVFAGYAMMDAPLGERLRLIAGPRLEASRQRLSSFDRLDPAAGTIETELNELAVLPAVSLVFAATPQSNLRLAVSRTIARPQLREMAPFSFTDFYGGREIQGNPDLRNTSILNADVRVEWFPTLREVLAASVFFKRFWSPIEQTVGAGGARGIVTYANIGAANLAGLELEARKSFDLFHEALRDLSLIANVTFAHSQITLAPEQLGLATNRSRPMSNQAPWTVNLALDYTSEALGFSSRVLYNVSGPSVHQVGINGLPDIYRQPFHQLDVRLAQELFEGFEATATAKNLINDDWRWTQGARNDDDAVLESWRTGLSFSVGASYTH